MKKLNQTHKIQLMSTLKKLLLEGSAKTQKEICQALTKQGIDINQTKISRTLRKLGVVKIKNEQGDSVYCIPKDPPPLESSSSVNNLVIDIVHNESIIVVHTSPGAAQVIARIIDYLNSDNEILGTIAGDNTIFIAPKLTSNVKQLAKKINSLFAL